MSPAHLHLILAHIPVVGFFLSLALLAYGLWRRDAGAQRIALVGLAFSGAMALAVFFSGEGAEETAEGLAGVSEVAIERHEDAAGVAALLSGIAGALAALALLWARRRGSLPRGLVAGVALAALVAFGAIGYTANLGGQIRHTEIAGGAAALQQGSGEGKGEHEKGEEEDEDDASLRGAAAAPLAALRWEAPRA